MIKTIRTWIYRIQNYEDQMEQLEKVSAKLRKAQAVGEQDALERIKSQNEMKRFVSLLSGNTWKEGDNMMEAIETYQQEKYLKEHGEDFLMIMTQNAPEVAAQELFEYFELEVPDSSEIEIETAKKIYDLWMRAQEEILAQRAQKPEKFYKYEDLTIQTKNKLRDEVYKIWNR